MKATLEIPDDLYRRVKARSALEGRTLRAVAIELFQNWLHGEPSLENEFPEGPGVEEIAEFPWLEISRKYARSGISHEMENIRESISRGWAAEATEKIASPPRRTMSEPGHGLDTSFGMIHGSAESAGLILVTFEKTACNLPNTLVLE